MAEAPTATVQTPPATSAAAPPPTDWDASLARLNDTMREAELAANAQRDQEAGTPMDEPTQEEPPIEQGDEAELPDEIEPDAEPGPADQAQEQEPPPQTEPKRYSRRDAARLDAELSETTRRLNEHTSRIQQYEQTDRAIIGRLAELTGADGSYERLSTRVLDGSATPDERNQVQQMTEWRKVAGPVYRVAQQEVWDAFGKDMTSLKQLEGVTEPVYQELLKAPNPATMLKRVFELGIATGEKRKASEATRLNAAVTDLRTKSTASKPQPVPASAGAPTNNGRTIDRVMSEAFTRDENGQLRVNPSFRPEKFTGVDLAR